jgi:four helix bundle protein
MATINKFEELEIWQLSRKFYKSLSPVIEILKNNKEYRFAEQMRSASGSVMDNIAEGFERSSRLEFLNSLGISKGEVGELKSQLYRCLDNNNNINSKEFDALYGEADILSRKIASFIIYLNSEEHKGLKFKDRLKS